MFNTEDGLQALDSPFVREAFERTTDEELLLPADLSSPFETAFTSEHPPSDRDYEFGEVESWQEPEELTECRYCRQRLQKEAEEPEFEYDLSSAPRDFSLKDIADKDNLPDAIRTDILRDGKTDVSDLANRAFWARHTDMVGQQLDKTGSRHAKLRAEWGVIAQQVKALIWLRRVIDELDKTRGNIPRDFLLGWMAVESDGKVTVVTSRPERGYFQIDWKGGEAREQLGLSETQFKKLSTDRVFSIEKGVELAEKYRQWILTNYPSVLDQSELLWRLTKGRHAASGSLKDVLDGLVRRKRTIEWAAVSPLLPGFMRRNVDATLAYAAKLKPFADLVGAPAPAPAPGPAPGPTQPELSGESAPWLEETDEAFTEESFEEEHRDPPKKVKIPNTFAIPFRWICKVAIRKAGKYHHGGSGVLISDRHVLTAAHVVYDVYKDRAQYDLEVTPALDGNDDLGTYSSSGKPHIPSLYDPEKPDYDYALITLDTAIGQKTFKKLKNDQLCFWGSPNCGSGTVLVRVDPKSLLTQTAYTAGYPKNKGASTMWCFSGLLVSVPEKTRTMSYTGEATEGQSGSPVWLQRGGQFMLVGVLVARGDVNIVVRVTREFVRQIADWIGATQGEAPEEEFAADLDRREWEQEEGEWEAEDEPLHVGETLPRGESSAFVEEYQTGGSTGLVLLDHMHVPKTPDLAHAGTFKVGSLTGLKTADMNPGFIDAADNLITDMGNTGLQTCLELSITTDFQGLLSFSKQTKPAAGDRVRVALVDLTGSKLTKPDFAGWGSTVAIYGASSPKILALYAAFQLRSDLRELISRKSPKDGADLERQAITEWNAKGLTKLLPNLQWLFDIRSWTPGATLDFTATARSINIWYDCQVAELIVNVGFPYIGSVTWQSGLYHPTRGGLWLRASYCGKATWASPVASPYIVNATALSAATYFTLLAQGRLVDDASSGEIRTALSSQCVTKYFPAELKRGQVVACKCGVWGGFWHDCVWIEDTEVRYAMAVMSRLATDKQGELYTKLCKELDALIRESNKSPGSRKICI